MRYLSDLVLSLRAIACTALLLTSIACIFQPLTFAQQGASITGILADSSGAGYLMRV